MGPVGPVVLGTIGAEVVAPGAAVVAIGAAVVNPGAAVVATGVAVVAIGASPVQRSTPLSSIDVKLGSVSPGKATWKPCSRTSPGFLPEKYEGLWRVKLDPEPVRVPSQKERVVTGRSVVRVMVYWEMAEVRGILSLPCQLPCQPFLSTTKVSQEPGNINVGREKFVFGKRMREVGCNYAFHKGAPGFYSYPNIFETGAFSLQNVI